MAHLTPGSNTAPAAGHRPVLSFVYNGLAQMDLDRVSAARIAAGIDALKDCLTPHEGLNCDADEAVLSIWRAMTGIRPSTLPTDGP